MSGTYETERTQICVRYCSDIRDHTHTNPHTHTQRRTPPRLVTHHERHSRAHDAQNTQANTRTEHRSKRRRRSTSWRDHLVSVSATASYGWTTLSSQSLADAQHKTRTRATNARIVRSGLWRSTEAIRWRERVNASAGSIRYAFVYLAQCSTCARIRYAGRTMLATPGYRFVVVVVRYGTVR